MVGGYSKYGSEKILTHQLTGSQETNIRGPYLHVYNFLQQHLSRGEEPTGTVIFVASAAASLTIPGGSSYGISKLANVRQAEFLHAGQSRTHSLGDEYSQTSRTSYCPCVFFSPRSRSDPNGKRSSDWTYVHRYSYVFDYRIIIRYHANL